MSKRAKATPPKRWDFLAGGGEMAQLVAATDWSQGPLGPIDGWPQSLRTALSLCLASSLPISLIWGPRHIQLYNDAYRALCGDAHPAAFGADFAKTWASAWPAFGEAFNRAMAGETVSLENQPVLLARDGAEDARLNFSFSPIRGERGVVVGLFHPVSETRPVERRARVLDEKSRDDLRETRERLEFALDAGRLGSWELDIAAGVYRSAAHSRAIFGLGPDDPFERAEDVAKLVHPDDRERRQRAIDRAITTGEDLDIEYRAVRPGGKVGWVLARGRAAFEGGRAVRLAGISLDITERKQAEEHQRLLLGELNHRVKNTLATVQSLALQTRDPGQAARLEDPFFKRLLALSQAHDLLTEASWEGASLTDVIRRTLDPHFAAGDDGRVRLSGPPIQLNPNAAVTLHMGFHELATNAMKYGALTSPTGRIDVTWTVRGRGAAALLTIVWRESGGPAVTTPTRRGFGSRMIERGIAHEFGGDARLTFDPAGLACHLRLPLAGKLRRAD